MSIEEAMQADCEKLGQCAEDVGTWSGISVASCAFAVLAITSEEGGYLTDCEVGQAVLFREEARLEKDWKTSDAVRDFLMKRGIELKDTPTGPRITRK